MSVDFERAPFVVAWEITRACALACQHCRAAAIPRRHPGELDTAHGKLLIDEIAAMGTRLLVLTGGDPMLRNDLPEFIAYARAANLHVALSPSATPRVTRTRLEACRAAGVGRVAVSLDGSTAAIHDAFRGVPGVFERTLTILKTLRQLEMSVQVNTTVCRQNLGELENIARVVAAHGAVMWSLFFLVPTGRGRLADVISTDDHENVLQWLYEFSLKAPFEVRTTEAPQYRRIAIERRRAQNLRGSHLRAGFQFASEADGIPRHALGVNDGKGFCFVSHIGEIQPSGFLPLTAGTFPRDSLTDTYRNSRLFRELRDPSKLQGKCGRCPYREICGGSRARAYAFTGNRLGEEPRCAYVPDSA